jgi:hypothetical protein
MIFDPHDYGPVFAPLIPDRLPELGPGIPNERLYSGLQALSAERAFEHATIADRLAARSCLAAVWLWNDFLHESHTISQEIETAEGSYWHGIMHRREPDYGNAKYWFRRVREHPIFQPLAEGARKLAAGTALDGASAFLGSQRSWNSSAFVDWCEAIARGSSQLRELAQQIARLEWQLLFEHSYRQAVGNAAP